MYRYYQKNEHGSWAPLPDDPEVENVARASGAKKLTILSVSTILDDENDDPHGQMYKGPLYIDIDCKDDLGQAIKSANELVEKLIELGVHEDYIHVWASGGKGFHIIVAQTVFSNGRPVSNLPVVYKEMALSLWVPGLDFQVYSQGRGNSWRLENVQRENGNYRVPIAIATLSGLTADTYFEYVKAPKTLARIKHTTKDPKAPQLEVLYRTSLDAVKKGAKRREAIEAVPDKKLADNFSEEPPQCVQDLVSGGRSNAVSLNQGALQLATFIVRSSAAPAVADSLITRMALSTESTKYNSEIARKRHIQATVAYVKSSTRYRFSCPAMRHSLKENPCDGCPLQAEHGREKTADAEYVTRIVETPGGYFSLDDEGEPTKRVTNFILNVKESVLQEDPVYKRLVRTGLMVELLQPGKAGQVVEFTEEAWASRSGMISAISGIGSAIYEGSDIDAQRLKEFIFSKNDDMNEITKVHTAGILIDKTGATPVRVYVEPKFSINQYEVPNTHRLVDQVVGAPRLHDVAMPQPLEEELEIAVTALMQTQIPVNAAKILGWHSACHLKAHIMEEFGQFPLLNIWGGAGSGKSQTANLVSWINGCDFSTDTQAYSLPTATRFPVLHYTASTTTIPRILEEYNQSKFHNQSDFNFFTEILKNAYNNTVVPRGTLSKGARGGRVGAAVADLPISAPLIILNEQVVNMPALQERSVTVKVSPKTKAGRKDFFEAARRRRHHLWRLAKLMTVRAMDIDANRIYSMYDRAKGMIDVDMQDRPLFNLHTLLVGLEYLKENLQVLQYLNAVELVDVLEAELIKSYNTTIDDVTGSEFGRSRVKSEMDAYITKIVGQINLQAMNENAGPQDGVFVTAGVSYWVEGDYLYLEPQFTHQAYARYMRTIEMSKPVVLDFEIATQLIRDESYCVDVAAVTPQIGSGTVPVWKLDTIEMKHKGLAIPRV